MHFYDMEKGKRRRGVQEERAQGSASSERQSGGVKLAGRGCSQRFSVGSGLEHLAVASSLELSVGQERSVNLMLMSREHTMRGRERKSVFYTPLKLLEG